jgi:hypothetical protein
VGTPHPSALTDLAALGEQQSLFDRGDNYATMQIFGGFLDFS